MRDSQRKRDTATRPPTALTIAGTDPSGGAGMPANLKTFTARGVMGTAIVTALVAQNTHGVSRVQAVDPGFVRAQFASVFDDLRVDATKSGMLGTRALVELVVAERQHVDFGFYTLDPVMVSTSGHRLLDLDAMDALRRALLPLADLITPNLPEAALLLGNDIPEASSVAAMQTQARQLLQRGPRAVLLKGGHAESGDVIDVLATRDGRCETFSHPRIDTPNTHGTGCTLSAAITAEVARARHAHDATMVDDDTLLEAVRQALDYLARALVSAADWQVSRKPWGAHGPVDHRVDIVPRISAIGSMQRKVPRPTDA